MPMVYTVELLNYFPFSDAGSITVQCRIIDPLYKITQEANCLLHSRLASMALLSVTRRMVF